MKKRPNPFKFISFIKNGKNISIEELKEFQPYLINRMYYFSGYERYSNLLNLLWSLPKEWQYKLMISIFKGKKTKKWIVKAPKKKLDEIIIGFLRKKYQCSTKVANDYFKLLSAKEKKEIRRMYK